MEDRDASGGKSEESVSNLIPIVVGKMKRGLSIGVGIVIRWVGSKLLFPSFFFSPSKKPTLNFVPDPPLPKLLEQTQMGTHPTIAQSILSKTQTSPTARSRCHPLLHGERP